ncbi:MAG: hypothetical protein JW953_06595 [Anaerolineae bacterium]|nr:hypothetical protein [Anaerolineae bacterium]
MENISFYLLYTLNTLLLVTGLLFSLKRQRVYSLIWAALAILQIISIFSFKSFLADFGLDTLVYGQALMVPANLLFLIMTAGLDMILLQNRRLNSGRVEVTEGISNRYFFIALAIVIFSIMLRFRHGVALALSDWESARASLGLVDSLGTLLGFIYFPSIWLALKAKRFLLFILLSLFGFIFFQITGSRAMLLTLLCVMYIDLLRSSMPYLQKLFLLIVLGAAGFSLHTFTRLVRGLGLAAFLALVTSGGLLAHLASYDFDLSGGESEIYQYYYYLIDKDYTQYPYKSGVTLTRLALIYIPGSMFPELKPADITYQIWLDALQDGLFNRSPYLHAWIAMVESGSLGSLHPTLWGDAYANLGILGMFFYPAFFGFILVMVEYHLMRLSYVSLYTIASIIGTGYLMVGRGNLVIGLGYIAYIIPLALSIFWLTKIPIIRKKNYKKVNNATYSLLGRRNLYTY